MKSLVQELQTDALNPDVRVSDLLRKAKVVAFKLDLSDSTEWIEKELNGYEGPYKRDEFPAYRVLKGEVKGYNPYHGWQPVMFANAEVQESASELACGQSVGQLDDLLSNAEDGPLMMDFPHDTKKRIIDGMNVQTDVRLFLSRTSVAGILDSVRNAVLDWSLNLEKKGVLGEGMSFTEKEKEAVASNQNTTYNIGNFAGTIGNVSDNAQVSIEQENSIDLKELAELLTQIQKYAPEVELPSVELTKVESSLAEIKEELQVAVPNQGKIRGLLGSMKSIFEGATGNVVAQGIIASIQAQIS